MTDPASALQPRGLRLSGSTYRGMVSKWLVSLVREPTKARVISLIGGL